MPIEGELVVRVQSRGPRVTAATARCVRPRLASRLFPGRTAGEAAPLARALYAVCGRSQAVAAAAAIEAIRGEPVAEAVRRSRARHVVAETLMEHSWRLLVDTPRLAGSEPDLVSLAGARRVLAPFLDGEHEPDATPLLDWARGALLGRAPAGFLAMETLDDFLEWTRWSGTPVAAACAALLAQDPALGSSDVALMPAANGWIPGLANAIDADPGFDEAPVLDGVPRETGPLARAADHPLVAAALSAWGRGFGARLVARLVESARLLGGDSKERAPRLGAVATGEGAAIAWVEAARGLLVHRVSLDGDRIAAYRIVAPTEWNFHPDGAFARGARALDAADAEVLEANVRRLVASLDPCVGVRYEALHA